MHNAATPTDRIHRHYIALLRAKHARRFARRDTLRSHVRPWATWHLRPLLHALRALRRHIGGHPHVLRQLLQVPWFAVHYRVDPNDYYRHKIYANWDRRNDFIFNDEIVEVLTDLNERASPVDSADLAEKRAFCKRCAAAGLPTIPILCEFENGVGGDRQRDARSFEADLFSKAANRSCGEGATLWRYADGHYRSTDRTLSLAELKSYLARQSFEYPIILQPKISNSQELTGVTGHALSTVRIVSIRRPQREPELMLVCFRMATGDKVADNFAFGGIAAPVSLDDGVLGAGVLMHVDLAEPIRLHPDTGAAIAGRALPHWQAVKALALAAHAAFPTMASVGWDIAITDDGPVLVEGNAVWGVDLPQLAHRTPLGDSIIPECIVEWLNLLDAN